MQVRRSGVHGKGVFALPPIPAGETIIEYIGERITWKEALRRHPHDPAQPEPHLLLPHRRQARHRCQRRRQRRALDQPRLRHQLRGRRGGRPRLHQGHCATCKPGEELFYDYGLVIDEPADGQAEDANTRATAAAPTAAARCSPRRGADTAAASDARPPLPALGRRAAVAGTRRAAAGRQRRDRGQRRFDQHAAARARAPVQRPSPRAGDHARPARRLPKRRTRARRMAGATTTRGPACWWPSSRPAAAAARAASGMPAPARR